MFEVQIRALIALSDSDTAIEISRMLEHRGITDQLVVGCTYDAIDAMLKEYYHLFIVDAFVPMSIDRPGMLGGVDFIRFLRMCEGPVKKSVAVFLRSELGRLNMLEVRQEIVTARDAGANCILSQPLTLKKFDESVVPQLLEPRPFLTTENYTGPCRRRKQLPVKVERREHQTSD